MYNLTKFARVDGAQSGNMCKVDHQALSYVKVLNETHLLRHMLYHFVMTSIRPNILDNKWTDTNLF